VSTQRAPRESLSSMLGIQQRGPRVYGAALESFWGATTPGDLLARATLATTAERREAPTAHQALFFSAPPPDVELSFACEAVGAGRERVTVHHGDARVCEVVVRYGSDEPGINYQSTRPPAGVPSPDDLPSEREVAASEGWEPYAVGPIESRRISAYAPVASDEPSVWVGWLRPREELPDELGLQAGARAFSSEYRSHWAIERRLGSDFPSTELTLLDHSLWVHHAIPWNDWWLVTTRSDVGARGRCLSRREIFARDGTLIASAIWEARARAHS